MVLRLLPPDTLRVKGVPYSKPHLWRLEKAGKFPKRVPVGAGRYAYVEAEIDKWIEDRVRERDQTSMQQDAQLASAARRPA
jgi:prophage regulatory protein